MFIWCLSCLLFVRVGTILLTYLLIGPKDRKERRLILAALQRCSLHWWGDHEHRCLVWLSHCIHSQEAEQDECCCSGLFLLFILSVQDLRPWNSAAHICSESSYLNSPNIENFPQACSAVCFHRKSK